MIYDVVVPQFTKMLGNLSAILDEAEKYAEEKEKAACSGKAANELVVIARAR